MGLTAAAPAAWANPEITQLRIEIHVRAVTRGVVPEWWGYQKDHNLK